MRACVLGSTNVDLVLSVRDLPRRGETLIATSVRREAGGKGANQACALARLGAEVRFVSAVGDDDDGRWSRSQLAAEGVDVLDVATVQGVETGRATVVVDDRGENLIVVVPGANDHVAPPEHVRDADALLLSLEVPLATVLRAAAAARQADVPVVLNAAPAQILPPELLSLLDVLVVNETELAVLGGVPRALRGAGALVVTLGADGCDVFEAGGSWHLPAETVQVVDSTGAGDCFAAALTFGVGQRWPLRRSAELAVAAAGHSVTGAGARGGLPRASDLAPGLFLDPH